jgi:hypothetical protein
MTIRPIDDECPKGFIKRKGYTRRFRNNVKKLGYTIRRGNRIFTAKPKKSSTYVPSACIKNAGLPGKGPRTAKAIGPLRKGELIKYGYSYRLADSARHAALKRAIERYGVLGVYHKLDAVAKLSTRTAPDASRIFAMDRDWVKQRMY